MKRCSAVTPDVAPLRYLMHPTPNPNNTIWAANKCTLLRPSCLLQRHVSTSPTTCISETQAQRLYTAQLCQLLQHTNTLCILHVWHIHRINTNLLWSGGRDGYKLKTQTQTVSSLISFKTWVFTLKTAQYPLQNELLKHKPVLHFTFGPALEFCTRN